MNKRRFPLCHILFCISLMLVQDLFGQNNYDWTGIMKNPSFESGTTGWTFTRTVSGWEDFKIVQGSAADGNQHYNIWAAQVSSLDISQTISLPAGHYTLSAQFMTNPQGVNDQHVYARFASGAANSQQLNVADQWTRLSVDFTLPTDGVVTIGAASTGTGNNEKGWFCIDDFRLTGNQDPGDDIDRTVTQVTQGITLNGRGALHITGTEPFQTAGSVNIVNKDYAVVFFDQLRPSDVKSWLSHVYINGQRAVSESNCQLRLYDHGTLLLPFGKENKNSSGFHPLTVYTGQYCSGESCESFGIENTDGYMNTLTDATLNNRIRSFRLKRGYMVTFSTQAEGRGYQRCFIADGEDLIVTTLPSILDGRISSYRIFRYDNIGKNGVANITNTTNLKKLNCTWTYTWGSGQSLGTDYECVPHMNHLWSSSTYSLGANDLSPYLKTDNEPANASDPSPASVAQELERWPDLMRTGRRLLSPSSWDGNNGWHKEFFDSIDARGWRCDIVDIHCYWEEGTFNGIKSNWADRFHRPVWITEFIWGASWSGGLGIFNVARTDSERDNPSQSILQQNRDVLARIWTKLNSWDYVERYAYWNDERACSKILWNGNLTPAGEYYAQMQTGPGYSGTYTFVPTDWRCQASTDLSANYKPGLGECTLTWTCHNGDLTETMQLQRRKDNGSWQTLKEWTRSEENQMTYVDELTDYGIYNYRVVEISYKNTTLTSNIETVIATQPHSLDELVNLEFNEGTYLSTNVRTYAKDITGNETSGLREVTGWTIPHNGDARAGGQFRWGSTSFLGTANYLAPSVNSEGNTTGGSLGIVGVWTGTAQYVQNVCLEPGTYTFTIPVYNSTGGTVSISKNLFGFIAEDDTEHLSDVVTFQVGVWTTLIVEFELKKKTYGRLSVGYIAANNGSADMPHLFADYFRIAYTPSLPDFSSLDALQNLKFDEGQYISTSIRTYDYDATGTEVSGLQNVTGWNITNNGNARSGAQFAWGANYFLGSPDNQAPSTNSKGNTSGGGLGIVAVWTNTVQYTQSVTLPAGSYTITIPVYNTGGTSAISKNLFGFVSDSDEEYYATATTFNVGEWTTMRLEFTLEEETAGKFSLGYTAANNGSADMPHLFVDYFRINSGDRQWPAVIVGDVNDDGTVSILDVTVLINVLLGEDVEYNHQAADVSGDGNVSILDLTALINLILEAPQPN